MINRIKNNIVRAYKRWVFSLSRDNHWIYTKVYLGLYQPKSGSLPAFLEALSQKKQSVFVLQVGANDGITHDPIHKFIKRHRWKGILLEPQPDVFENSLQPIYSKHPEIKTINAAIGAEDAQTKLYSLAFSKERWATGLARFDRESLLRKIKSGDIDHKIKKHGVQLPPDEKDWILERTIAVRSPDSILKEHNVHHIDLLMIDTEGYDFEVLKLMPFDRIKPSAIVFEDMHLSQEDQRNSELLLEQYGYQHIRRGPNTIAWQDELSDIATFT